MANGGHNRGDSTMTQQTIVTRSAIVDRAALAEALKSAKRVIERRNTIPILTNVLLRGTAQGLDLIGTDLELEIRAPLNGFTVADKGFAVTVSAHTLLDVVKANESEAVEMQHSLHSLSLDFGGRNASLATLPAEDFPEPDHGEFPCTFTLPGAVLRTLFEQTHFAISTEETRFYLNGVYLHAVEHIRGATLRCVATDGHRMAVADIPAPEGSESIPGVIVPRKTVNVVLAMLPKPKRKGPELPKVRISVSTTRIRFEIAGNVLTSKVVDGTFPEYQRVIPRANSKLAMVDRKAFADAVSRVSKLSSERGKAVKLSFEDGYCILSVHNPDSGTSEELIECEYEAKPMEIGFNASYLLDLLATYPEDRVTLRMEDPGSPMVIWTPDESLLLVQMPMRV
jgi:DNA polymerase-3 subunit beta